MSKLSIHHRDQTFGKSRIHIPRGIRREINCGIYVIDDRIYYPRDVKSRVFQFSSEFDLEYTDEWSRENTLSSQFQYLLFNRVMPNLKKIGLLPD